MKDFEIEVLEQKWISDDAERSDLCSHGKLRLIIADENILSDESNLDWTLNTSALRLLRTIESNHIAKKDFELILHCGGLLMMNCPIGVYFDLEHNGNKVKVSNIKKQFGVGEADSKLYSGIEVVLDKTSYAKEVIKFAGQV